MENIGSERTLPGLLAPTPVNSPSRITLENNGKIRPRRTWEKLSSRASGGGNATGGEPSLGRKLLIYNDVAIFGIGGTPNCACGLMFCSDTATTQPRLLVVADIDAALVQQQILDVAKR